MHQKLQCLQPELVNKKDPIILHDNAQPHVVQPMLQKLNKLGYVVLPHLSYSPELSPTDYHFFKYLDNFLQGKCFHNQLLLLLSPVSRVWLCGPHRRQPTRLLRPWDSPGKNTGVGCHLLLQCIKVKVNSLSRVSLSATPWTAAYQAPPSMGSSRQEYWSGLPLPSPSTTSRMQKMLSKSLLNPEAWSFMLQE